MSVALTMVLVVVASLIFHFVSPWRATPIASNWGFIDRTMELTFWVTTAGFVAVVIFMAYSIYRFSHEPGRRAAFEPEDRRLELWLAGITAIGVVVLLAPGLLVWNQYINPPDDALEVEAMGAQWSWSFRFPGSDQRMGSSEVRQITAENPLGLNPADPAAADDLIVTAGELHVPLGRSVKVLLRSVDVLHDFYVPEIRAKMDLVPGMETYFWFTPTRTGAFDILCAAYCGTGHPQMRGALVIESKEDFEKWLGQQKSFSQIRKATNDRSVHPSKS